MTALPQLAFDHAVVAASSLDVGAAWCERTFGVIPARGGAHAFMGTHNRLLRIASARFADAYLDVIAIDPAAPAPPRPRWFGLDEPALQEAIAAAPRLVHWVARVADIDAATESLRALGIEPGEVVAAERRSERGLLRWRISLRSDGGRTGDGAVPALIEWQGEHPANALGESGVSLAAVTFSGAAEKLAAGFELAGAVRVDRGASAPLRLAFESPRGPVLLDGLGAA